MKEDFDPKQGYCLQCFDKKFNHNQDGCTILNCGCPVSNQDFPFKEVRQ